MTDTIRSLLESIADIAGNEGFDPAVVVVTNNRRKARAALALLDASEREFPAMDHGRRLVADPEPSPASSSRLDDGVAADPSLD